MNILNKIYSVAVIFAFIYLAHPNAQAAHYVAVEKAVPILNDVSLNLIADVKESSSAQSNSISNRSYLLTIDIPNATVLNLSIGATVPVILPTIRNRTSTAQVISISKEKILLRLSNQVQLLDGQRLQVTLPAKPINLFQIVHQSIYSPRARSTEVFVVEKDMTVKLVSVAPLKLLSDGGIIVSSTELSNANVVVRGIDNLVPGDKVQLTNEKEERK